MSKFITDIQPEIAAPPVAPPPGGGTLVDVMFRNVTEVLFGRASVAEGAQRFVDEPTANLQG